MTRKQEAFFAMALKVTNFYSKNATEIGTLSAIVPFYLQLETLISQLIAADTGSRANLKGYALMKQSKRKALEFLAQKVNNALASYALFQGDVALQTQVNFTASSWYRINEEKLITQATIVSNLATPLANSLSAYLVTATDVSNLSLALSDFVAVISAPKLAKNSRKEDNKEVKNRIIDIRTILQDKMDVYMRSFELSNPSLYGLYTSARAIDSNG
jgi:CelD/BcsL family acetyltransferase involved in cellulose biosynthesis